MNAATGMVQNKQLDEVSRVVGGMETAIANLERYIHDFRHDENNRRHVEQDFQDRLLRQLEKLRQEIQADRLKDQASLTAQRLADRVELDGLKTDVTALKAINLRRDGVKGALDWFATRIGFGWIAAAVAILWHYFKGDKGL